VGRLPDLPHVNAFALVERTNFRPDAGWRGDGGWEGLDEAKAMALAYE
jgi:hypothetical protein